MAYTTEQLTALENVIADGVLTVKYGEKQVTYRSLDEMIRIRNLMRSDLGLTDAAARRVTPVIRKGLNGGE